MKKRQIIFATSNAGKAATLQRHLVDAGCDDVEVIARDLSISEPQADTALEIARAKATDAYTIVKSAVVVDDSSFHVPALGGFPGPYQKYMAHTIGLDGFLRLMQGVEDRSAYFISNLVYVDDEGNQHEFSDDPYWGTLLEEYNPDEPYDWGIIGRIFVPKGMDKPLTQLERTKRLAVDKNSGRVDAYIQFTEWYRENC